VHWADPLRVSGFGRPLLLLYLALLFVAMAIDPSLSATWTHSGLPILPRSVGWGPRWVRPRR